MGEADKALSSAQKFWLMQFFNEGKYIQAFPAFGVERRGAPVTAFCRVDDKPIYLRNQIYQPDQIVILDPSMIETVNVTEGLKPRGMILINSPRSPEHYLAKFGNTYRLFVVDAAAIAVSHRLGSASNPIVNTAILGAFAKASQSVELRRWNRPLKNMFR